MNAYNQAVKRSLVQLPIPDEEAFKPVYDRLRRHRIRGHGRVCSRSLCWRQYKAIVGSSTCRIHTGNLQNSYPVASCRTSRNSSSKIQLHQVPHYVQNGWVFKPTSNSTSFNHRCHNSNCLVHAVCRTKEENIADKYCRSFIIIGKNLVHTCIHDPSCLNYKL